MTEYLTHKTLAVHAAQAAGIKEAQARTAVEAVFDAVANAMKAGSEVRVTGFGTFSAPQWTARTARNPFTGGTVEVPAKRRPKFKPSPSLKTHVAG